MASAAENRKAQKWTRDCQYARDRYELHRGEFERAVKREDKKGQDRHWAASEKAWAELQELQRVGPT